MIIPEIRDYNDFITELLKAGFAANSSNGDGIFTLIPWDWKSEPPYDTPVRWHTGETGTDPWEWRIRVLNERNDIAYSKFFFKKSGYITKQWYPFFLSARRGGKTLEDAYEDGLISRYAKKLYDCITLSGPIALHDIKTETDFKKEDKELFERSLVELQMGLYITMCGSKQKISQKGEEYGWHSTVFCTTEEFWSEEMFHTAALISKEEAVNKITEQVLRLNPDAESKKISKFILSNT